MKVYQKFNGGNLPSVREYDIASSTAIEIGEVVKLSAGLVVSVAAGETGAILGVAMENHSGSVDALDPRANGTKILVCDADDAVLACPAAEITCSAAGTTTTFVANTLGAYANDDWNGGYILYNGSFMRITDYAYSSGTSTFTVATMAAAPASGDTFKLFPPYGLAKGAFDSDGLKVVHTAVTMTCLKACGRDEGTEEVLYKAASHF